MTGESPDDSKGQPALPLVARAADANCSRYIHSDVWDRLVSSSDNLTGIVAYGLYQLRKREWIEYHARQYGHLPSEDEVKAYSASQRDAALRSLREDAEGKMFRFADEFAETQMPEMQRQAFNHRTIFEITTARSELEKIARNLNERTGYLHHVKTHVAGFFVVAAIIALVTVAVSFEKSPREIVSIIGNALASHDSANTPSTAAKPDEQARHSRP